MRKVLLFSLLSFVLTTLLFGELMAQDRTITGKVTRKGGGETMPGVNIIIKGTRTGTVTNVDGTFSLKVPSDGGVLVFNFVGMKPAEVEIGSQSVINIEMEEDVKQLEELVVTGAYGTTRTEKSTTSNAQVVESEKLNTIRQTNINNALAGKVAGLQVRSQSAAALGRETTVRLRGATGFSTGSGAIYVVDGTILPNSNDVNLDDIASVSVLQGPAASALFGSRGANGAIVITTKKGKKQEGIGVTIEIGAQVDKVNILPNYQNKYAGGGSSSLMQYTWKDGDPEEWKALDGKYYHDYSDDASWGPKMEGQEYIPWYAWYGGHDRSYQTASLTPQPDNARDFFNTGLTLNNSISISSASDDLSYRISYGNQSTKGLIPNSDLTRNTLSVNTTYDINDHLEFSGNINFVNRKLNGMISDDYGNMSTGSFNQWFHRDVDMGIMKELRNLKTEDGVYATWNHANPSSYDADNPTNFYGANYWYNFYTYFDNYKRLENRDQLYGNLALTYKINEHFKVKGTYRKSMEIYYGETKISTDLEESGLQTGMKGYYGTWESYSDRRNIEFLASYAQQFNDFDVQAQVGSDFYSWVYKYNGSNTNNGLNVPNLYTISNSIDDPSVGNSRIEEKYRALFGTATLAYKDMVFFDVTLRNDWYSTLPEDNAGVLSKSFGMSFVFSDMLPDDSFISLGKVRASWGETPQALGTSEETFGAYRYPGFSYSVGSYKWNGNFLMNTPDQLVDAGISGSVSTQTEVGVDLGILANLFQISATYWFGTDKDFPYSLTVNGAGGYTSVLTNIGEIERSGLEFQLTANIFSQPNFKWSITGTASKLVKNDIVELSDKYNVTQTNNVGTVWGTTMPYMVHTEGKRWGQIYGNGIKRIDGKPVLDDNGYYENDPDVYFGSVLPEVTGGIQNTFQILKDFTVSVNIDYQFGGKFVSLSNMWGAYSGLTARTAATNDNGMNVRDAVEDGGGVHVTGVNESGEPVEYYLESQDYYHGLYSNQTFDEFIYDLTFIKLRELSVGYNIPVDKLNLGKVIQKANLSLVARSPFLIYRTNKDFDPSEIDATVGETGQLPGTRSYGFNLKVQF